VYFSRSSCYSNAIISLPPSKCTTKAKPLNPHLLPLEVKDPLQVLELLHPHLHLGHLRGEDIVRQPLDRDLLAVC
jgi:hypothetical protein